MKKYNHSLCAIPLENYKNLRCESATAVSTREGDLCVNFLGWRGKVGSVNLLGNVGKMRIFFGKALNPRSKGCFCIVLRSWFFVLRSWFFVLLSCAFVLLSWQIKCSLNVEKSFNALRAPHTGLAADSCCSLRRVKGFTNLYFSVIRKIRVIRIEY